MRMMRASVLATAVIAVALAGAAPVASASVAVKGPNPCTLLKRNEIKKALGQSAAAGKKGFSTPINKQCLFAVSAGNGQPEGEVTTIVQTVGAKIAFDTNRKIQGNEKVAGIAHAYYSPRTGALTMLVGGNLLVVVQTVFVSSEPPIGPIDRKAETTALAKIARKRA